ncbi:putative ribonuclease H-like domain-containing protein [Tanacetum coccineum]
MTGNMSYLSNFKEFDGGYVTLGGRSKGGKITGKETLKTGKLDFEDASLIGKSDDDSLWILMNVKAFRVYNNDTRKEKKTCMISCYRISQDYILMPLWKDGLLFDSSSKSASNDEPQPPSDTGKKDDEDVCKESGIDAQERPKNSPQDVNTVGPSINTESDMFSLGNNNILKATHADFFGDETKVNMSNITTTYLVPSTSNTRIHKDHSLDHVIGDVQFGVQTRRMINTTNEQGFINAVYVGKTHEDLHTYLFSCFLSQEEPKRIVKALSDSAWVEAMQEELLQLVLNKGHTQEEGIDYDEVFAPVARIEAIGLFLAYASFMGFMVYQMDVKSAFLFGSESTLWFASSSKSLVYVDDIIFGSSKKELCTEFEKLMHDKFQMSSMRKLTLFLGLQVTPKKDRIFISQDKYVADILRKFSFTDVRKASTLMDTEKPLLKNSDGDDVDVHLCSLMIGSLMYLTSSRPGIMYLKGQPKLGLWYPRDSSFDLVANSDSDYDGASLDKKCTKGGCQFLG